MKTFSAALLAAAYALDSEVTEMWLIPCTDNMPTTTAGCMKADFNTVDNNGALSWKWMLTSMTNKSSTYSTAKTNAAYCNYLAFPYTNDANESMQQTLADCAQYVSATEITEDVQTFDSLTTFRTTYSHYFNNASSYLFGPTKKTTAALWVLDDAHTVTVTPDSTAQYTTYTTCSMRPFEDSTVALTAGESVSVKGSHYIWKTFTASSSSSAYGGEAGDLMSATVLDAVEASATTLVAAAATAVVALNF